MVDVVGWAQGAINTVTSAVQNAVSGTINNASNIVNAGVQTAQSIGSGISSGIQTAINNPAQAISGAASAVGGAILNTTPIGPLASSVSSFLNQPAAVQTPVSMQQPINLSNISSITPVSLSSGLGIYSQPALYTNIIPQSLIPSNLTLNVPFGNYAQTQVSNLNSIIYDPVGGGFAGYQVPYGHSIANIVTSGSTGALQSGMFSLNPETPVVYTQASGPNKYYADTANPILAAAVLASPLSYSRLGAEAYGGKVSLLDNRTLSATTEMGRYDVSTGNLANLVNPYGANLSKTNFAEMPWSTPALTTPGIFSIDTKGTLSAISEKGLESIGLVPKDLPSIDIGAPPSPFKSTISVPSVSSGGKSWLENADAAVLGFLGIGAQGLEQKGTSGIDVAPKPFLSVVAPSTTFEPGTPNLLGINIPSWMNYVIPGSYNVLQFFTPGKEVVTSYGIINLPEVTTLKGTTTTNLPESTVLKSTVVTPIAGGNLTTYNYETTGGKTTTYNYETTGGKTTTTTTTTTPTLSQFDTLQNSIYDKIASGIGSVFGVSESDTKKVMEDTTQRFVDIANKYPLPTNIVMAFTAGSISDTIKHPIVGGVNLVLGVGMGTGYEAVTGLYETSRASAAEEIISSGQTWRAADIFSGAVMENAPKVLAGLYGLSVASRSTEGFTNFQPGNIAATTGGIFTTETIPMSVGFMLPGKAIAAIKLSDQGYQAALLKGQGEPLAKIGEGNVGEAGKGVIEPSTTGRFDYYIRQPLAAAYETDVSPITQMKLEIPQFVEEAGGSTPKGLADYATYKVGNAYQTTIEQPIKAFAQELPGALEGLQYKVLEPIVNARVMAQPLIEAALGKASVDVARYQYGEVPSITERAYSAYFNAKLEAPNILSQASSNIAYKLYNTDIWLSQSPRTALSSAWQEWKVPERMLYLSSFGGYTSLSQGLPPEGWGIVATDITSNIGTSGFGGGTSGAGGRIETKTVGGTQVSGLVREPSLRSQGVSDISARTDDTARSDFAANRAVDYRGTQSETMKPMTKESLGYQEGKQAAGISIFSEELPAIEGMPAEAGSRIDAGIATLFAPSRPSIGANTVLVSVIEPDLIFGQDSQTLQRQEISIEPISFRVALPVSSVAVGSQVAQWLSQSQLNNQISRVISGSALQTQQDIRDTVSSKDILYGRDVSRISDVMSKTDQTNEQFNIPRFDITTLNDITQTTSQKITPTQIITPIQIVTPTQIITPTQTITPSKLITTVPWLPGYAGGGAGSSGLKGPKYLQVETFYLGPRMGSIGKSKAVKMPKMPKTSRRK